MKTINALRALGQIDAKSVRRDPLLRWMVVFPLLLALVMRWGIPALTLHLVEKFQFEKSVSNHRSKDYNRKIGKGESRRRFGFLTAMEK